MPYILSPEQKVVADAILHQSSTDTKYFDINVAFHAVAKALAISIKDKKTIQIHVPDIVLKNEVISLLAKCGLDELAIDLANNNPVPEKDIVNLRTILKKKVDTTPIITNEITGNQLVDKKSEVLNYYQALDRKVLSGVSFRDFSRTLIHNNQNNGLSSNGFPSIEGEFDFSSKELYTLKKEIQEASQLYEAQFELYDQLTLLRDDIWQQSPEEITKASQDLSRYKERANRLSIAFQETFKDLRKQASSSLYDATKNLANRLIIREESCISFFINTKYASTEDSKFSLFGKKQKTASNKIYVEAFDELSTLIKEVSSEWYAAIDAPTTEEIDYEYISKFISNTKEALPVYKSQIGENLDNSIHRINRINTTSEEVKSLDVQLTEFITEVENAAIFTTSFGNNTLSYTKQMELIKQIESYLTNCEVLMGNASKYTKWKTFIGTCNPLIGNIIQNLKTTSKDNWESTFEQWYFDQMQSTIISSNIISVEKMTALIALKNENLNSSIPALVSQLQNDRLAATEELKSSSKELYSTLFKKKSLPTTSWNDISLMSRSFMKAVFPIHITSNISNTSEYDLVLSFSRRPKIFEENSKIHYISPIETSDIESRQESNDLFLYLNHYEYGTRLDQLANTDKLKAAKKIAKYILSLNQQVKIYQLKSANIISLLPTQDDFHFENAIEPLGVKTIDTDGVLYDRLTESILFTDRNPYLIIKDQLINPELHSHIFWQLNLIELFKSAGYKIISINTCDQLDNSQKAFDDLLANFMSTPTIIKQQTDDHEVIYSEEAPLQPND